MVLKDKVIIILGNTRYDGPIQATSVFIAQNLALHNKVFFIDYPFTIKDFFSHLLKKNGLSAERLKKYSIFSDGLLETELPGLKIVITPPVIPVNFLPEGKTYRNILYFNECLIRKRLKKIIKAEKIKEFIFINSFNFHYPDIAKGLHPLLTVYHCVDPMIVPYDMKHGIQSEAALVSKSDLVICTSMALYREKSKENKNTYFVPNATDSDLLEKVQDKNLSVHAQVRGIKSPIVGYLGTIERRINYQLLQQVAEANPDYSFVLAGPVTATYLPQSLAELENVHLLGAIPYDQVPQLIKSFDIAIIPFKKDEVSNTIFPIKLFEYLGAGKPVIATDFNDDLREFTEDQVSYCSDAESFSLSIRTALMTNSEELIQKRKELAAKNTWENRTAQIASIIAAHLEKKNA